MGFIEKLGDYKNFDYMKGVFLEYFKLYKNIDFWFFRMRKAIDFCFSKEQSNF
jgi:hypothetical protein